MVTVPAFNFSVRKTSGFVDNNEALCPHLLRFCQQSATAVTQTAERKDKTFHNLPSLLYFFIPLLLIPPPCTETGKDTHIWMSKSNLFSISSHLSIELSSFSLMTPFLWHWSCYNCHHLKQTRLHKPRVMDRECAWGIVNCIYEIRTNRAVPKWKSNPQGKNGHYSMTENILTSHCRNRAGIKN